MDKDKYGALEAAIEERRRARELFRVRDLAEKVQREQYDHAVEGRVAAEKALALAEKRVGRAVDELKS